MQIKTLKYLLLCLLFFVCIPASAQEYVIQLKHWDVKNGLLHRQVICMCQDRQGFIWIGTPIGLGRFDGVNFTWFTHEKDGIPFNVIAGMAEDADGNLLLVGNAAEEKQIFLFDPVRHLTLAKCNPELIPRGTYFVGISKLQDGRVLITASHHNAGLPDGTQSGEPYHENYLWDAKRGFSPSRVPQDYSITGIMWEENAYLAENSNNELCLLSVDGKLMKKVKAPFGQGTACGLNLTANRYVQNYKTQRIYRISPDIAIHDVTSELPALEKSDNRILFDVGIDSILWRGGLFHPSKGVLRDFVKEGMDELRASSRLFIFAEKNNKGRIWMCGDFGLYMLSISRNKFRQYFGKGKEAAIVHNSYRSILVHNNYLYCCNERQGVYRCDLKTGHSDRVIDMPVDYFGCYALAIDSAGEITGSLGNNIFFLSPGTPVRMFPASPDKNNRIWTIYEYASGKFLLGMSTGIILFDKGQGKFLPFERYNGFTELQRALVLGMSKDRTGNIWMYSDRGFYLFDPAKGIMERYSRDDTGGHYLPAKEFQHFYQDDDGIYWLATTDGLIRWDKQHAKYRLFTRIDGLSNNNIYAVYGDRHNRLWLSSDYGIMQFDKLTGAVKPYLTDDGVTDNEFNRKSHYMDNQGVLYFGSLNGITSFNPDDFGNTSTMRPAKLAVASFQQFNGKTNRLEDKVGELVQTNKITMLPDDRFFTLEFSLLNYSDPEQTTYYWKIDGIDPGWNVQKDHTLRFSRLPYGKKKLRVKAQAADGSWSANELSFALNVVRPFYLQTWFLLCAVAALFAAAIGLYRWRVYRFRKENQRLDMTVKQKTRDLQESLAQKDVLMKEIHHRVKNNLQVIGTLLDLQLSNIDDEKARKAVTEGMGRVKSIGLMHHQLYKENDFSTLEFSQFAEDLFTQVTSIFRKPGQTIKYYSGIPELFLDIDTAVPLGLILNELMTNSNKYAFEGTKDGSITIVLTGKGDPYVLIYSDSGPGMPTDYDRSKSSSLGMMVIEGLAKQLGGGFAYDAEQKKFIITFKGKVERKKIA